MFNEDEWVPISALAHYDFCPRRVALINSENIWTDNQWTVEGKILHEKTDQENHKTAHGIRFVRSLRISSANAGLYGIADVVEFKQTNGDEFEDNRNMFNSEGVPLSVCSGKWFPVPIEFKRGKTRSDESYEIQLCAQGLCLEEKYSLSIPFGYIYFGQSGHRNKIMFSDVLRNKTCAVANEVRSLLLSDKTPKAIFSKRCRQCSLVNLCLPEISKSGSVERYFRHSLEDPN